MHITEFNTSYRPDNPIHDTAYNAAYLAPVLAAAGDLVDSFAYWTFCDVFEELNIPTSFFHGFGLLTHRQIAKPRSTCAVARALHWARPTETLRPAEVSRLLEAVREVLTEALKAGGTSFDALYVNVNGESGYFDRSLNAYGREGEPCGRCATPIRRDSFMNRPRTAAQVPARHRRAAAGAGRRRASRPAGTRQGYRAFRGQRHVRSITLQRPLVGSQQQKAPRCRGLFRVIVCLTAVSLVRLTT